MREVAGTELTRLQALDALLQATAWLWRPIPYKEITPSWTTELPELAAALLALTEDECQLLEGDASQALCWLGQYHAPCLDLDALCQINQLSYPVAECNSPLHWEVAGRKWQQIGAFCSAIARVDAPIVEWCGGKGHLGRYASRRWRQPVTTLECSEMLCQQGARLAQRGGCNQQFHVLDVLSAHSAQYLPGSHVLALHACGDLHRELVRKAVVAGASAMHIAPCCYHLGRADGYQPFNADLQLRPSREDLRIAVTEHVTASERERLWREKETAWKLGFDAWQRDTYSQGYLAIKPIPKAWIKNSFSEFMQQLTKREGMVLPNACDYAHYEQHGEQRRYAFQRYNIVRAAFRRAIEYWLALDIATYLQQSGYIVSVKTFCPKSITPRNILVSAVRDVLP